MTSVLMQSPEGGHHVVNELPFEPIWFGAMALAALLGLLALLWSFRNTLLLEPVEHHDQGPSDHRHGDQARPAPHPH